VASHRLGDSWCECTTIRSIDKELTRRFAARLREQVAGLPAAAFALTDHDPSPLVWKSDVLELLEDL
jgi:hypothetical protein